MIEPKTVTDLLQLRARSISQRPAFTFLSSSDSPPVHLSFAELDYQARLIASAVLAQETRSRPVLLIFPTGPEYLAAFFGCLYAGALAVPLYPPKLNRSLQRLESILLDAKPALILSTAQIISRLRPALRDAPAWQHLRWLAVDTMLVRESVTEPAERLPQIAPDNLAFLQYTSGSTSAPRGVMVTHANLLHNQRLIQRAFRQGADSIIASWLPLYHDMGLIGTVLQPLYSGSRCVLMSPQSFLQQPARWLQTISGYHATTSGGPSFAYDLCVNRISEEEMSGLDLGCWEVAFNGSEPVRERVMRRFAERFARCGFQPKAFVACYGLAEATLLVCASEAGREPDVKRLRGDELAQGRAVQEHALEQTRAMTEAMTDASAPVTTLVSCGRGFPDQQLLIVDPHRRIPLPAGIVGEVWASGPSIAQGYWNRPGLSAEVFQAQLADLTPAENQSARHGTAPGSYLRTGDMGFLDKGQLYLTGRLKDLIIIRGLNHYPQDIEWTVRETHPLVRDRHGAAFLFTLEDAEQVVLVQEVNQRASLSEDVAEEVTAAIRQAVSEAHEIALTTIVLVKPHTIPLTTSGKVQRHLCCEQYEAGTLQEVWRWTGTAGSAGRQAPIATSVDEPQLRNRAEIERWLATHLTRRLELTAQPLDVSRPLTSYGLDSLLALELLHAIESRLQVNLTLPDVLEGASVEELARRIEEQLQAGREKESHSDVQVMRGAEKADAYPLSHGQQALWFTYQLAPDSAAYNISAAVRLLMELDVKILRNSFQRLLDGHDVLRNTFHTDKGMPVQKTAERAEVWMREHDAAAWGEEQLRNEMSREAHSPFDLRRGPIMRVNLYRRSAREHLLLVSLHHIVADFWSLAVMLQELGLVYTAEKTGQDGAVENLPEPPAMQYRDYVAWQERLLAGEDGERLRKYWEEQLKGELPVLELPTERARPAAQTYRGAAQSFRVSREITGRLKEISRANGATLYVTLLAGFEVLLSRYSGSEEVLVGTPVSGRSRAEMRRVVGYFVNPVVVRGRLRGEESFEQFLEKMKGQMLGAFAHQDYPFALLVEHLHPHRDPGRPSIFQASFVMQKTPFPDLEKLVSVALGEAGTKIKIGDFEFESVALEQKVSQFDLTLAMAELDGTLAASMQYNTDLFDADMIAAMQKHFQALLRAIAHHPDQPLAALPLLSDEERQHMLLDWNDTRSEYPKDKCLHHLFAAQAAKKSEAVALLTETEKLTYGELNQRTNQLARYLKKLGVRPDMPVGICMERSVEMVVGLLGILKAGGAYVPFDPEYPKERLAFMAEDTGIALMLTQEHLAAVVPEHGLKVVSLDAEWHEIARESVDHLDDGALPSTLAYIIYTSGSTGLPKGAMNTHQGICNRLAWMQQEYSLTEADRVLQKTPFSFDVSVWEFFWPLIAGAQLVLARPGGHRDNSYLAQFIRQQQITTLHFVPSMLQAFLDQPGLEEKCRGVRRVICSGEALSFSLQERFYRRLAASLHNLYGPTEAAVDVTSWDCPRDYQRPVVPIGRPIANTQVYILDRFLQPVPGGVSGELYLGGAALARGYLHRPDLTAEKFLPNPFSLEPGARMYKTGDVARYRVDGNIEFKGRLDYQVKVRGFRVELGEIEATLRLHPGVREAVVMAKEEQSFGHRLVAYWTTAQAERPGVSELKEFLKGKLPDYMIPSIFMTLDELPLMPNGKINRAALPEPGRERPELGAEFVAPASPLEKVLAGMWCKLLNIERVGTHDSFFELGGHSILVTQMISLLQEVFPMEFPLLTVFFENPTVAGLSSAIQSHLSEPEVEKIIEALEVVVQLSNEEVEALLAAGEPVEEMFSADETGSDPLGVSAS
jgi:amino acid adenylation domain-containing protein